MYRATTGNQQAPPAAQRPPQRRRRRWYRRPGFWLGLLFFALLAVFVLGATVAYAVANIPLPTELDTSPTTVLDKNGKEIGQLSAEATREDVALADIPEHTVRAVLAAEDAEFYEHPGVSVPGIVRAAVRNVRSGEVRQGGSTISQQYVKTVTGETEQTSMRKVREAVLAMKLERQVSKDQILEYYLNTIYFGRGAYGIQAASRAYFDKDVGDLTVGESALLAGFIPAPSVSDPVDHPDRAAQRYQYVVGQLGTLGWIDGSRAAKLSANQPEVTAKAKRSAKVAPHFMAMVERELADRLGGDQAYRGLTVQTTLDPRLQRKAEKAYTRQFDDLRDDLRSEFGKDVKVPTGAMVSLDPKSGAIRALVGGRAKDEYNLVTGGPRHLGRQPGSTFKPFALAAWLTSGRSPESRFDAPATMEFTPEESGTRDGWTVSNYGLADYGTMTLREATWNSVNTVYAQTALEVGPQAIADLAQEAGVTSALDPNASIVLGTGEVTPLDLASAYNTLASGGVARTPRTIEKVTDESGEVRYQPSENKRRVLSKGVAWTVVDVLRGVIEQGSGVAAQLDRPAAGKTGTTQDAADTWFAGFTRELTTVTWMGYRDSNQPMPGSPTGGGLTAELWADYMSDALDGVEPKDFPEPSGEYEIVGEPSPEPSAPPVVEEPEEQAESEPAAVPSEDSSDLEESAEDLEARLREELERRRDEEQQEEPADDPPQTEPPTVGDGPNVVPPEDDDDPPWWESDD